MLSLSAWVDVGMSEGMPKRLAEMPPWMQGWQEDTERPVRMPRTMQDWLGGCRDVQVDAGMQDSLSQ